MKRMTALLVPLFFMAPLSYAETGGTDRGATIDHLLTLDAAYAVTGLLNQGWGMGLSFEEKIGAFLSVKGTLGHMTFLTGIDEMYCTSVNIALFVHYYPFGGGLDKLYLGVGNGCDFMNYFGGGDVPPDAEDTLLFITPRIGWKFIMGSSFLLDVSAGYKWVMVDAHHYPEIKKYTYAGPQFGLGFKILGLFNARSTGTEGAPAECPAGGENPQGFHPFANHFRCESYPRF
ncbi:MAG: hypothetical protein LBK61_09700 [Spirochaetaceae bacterium]|jgi:hypothetical protein|nr:hypothetical protein [Spirochaetaceae bacterium]